MEPTSSVDPDLLDREANPLSPVGKPAIFAAGMIIFLVAVGLRLPACQESLWLDELHSAWVVWDSVDEVSTRAAQGHQPPLYFWALWCWKQIFGGRELALRLSSVVLAAAAALVTTVAVSRWTGSLIAGAAAGLVLAVERNSLFFGTELRPYAAVIFFSSIAVGCFVLLFPLRSRRDHPWLWSTLIVSILLAALCQPTAVGVLLWLPCLLVVIGCIDDRRSWLQLSLLDGLLAVTASAVALTLWESTLGQSWSERDRWAVFARATHIGQLYEIWDWTWLLSLPAALAVVGVIVCRLRGHAHSPTAIATLALVLVATGATACYWLVSWLEWAPLWHRRYFIAVLPIFAFAVGGGIAAIQAACWHPSRRRGRRMGAMTAVVAASMLLSGLMVKQRTLSDLIEQPAGLVRRGEDWRGAAAWLRSRTQTSDLVNLDSGLIESGSLPVSQGLELPPGISEEQRDYLRFPLRGPYHVDAQVIPIRDLRSLVMPAEQSRIYVVTRRPAWQLEGQRVWPIGETIGFGNVSVFVMERTPPPKSE